MTNNNRFETDDHQNNIIDHWHRLLLAIGFLSCLPVYRFPLPQKIVGFDKTACLFPLAGVVIAVPSIGILLVGHYFALPALLSAILAIGLMVGITGALHEDGLADVFDGFGGGKDKQAKLDIMKDSRLGTYGTLALLFVVLIKIAALSHLIASLELISLALIWIAIAGISRGVMVYLWCQLPPAYDKGLSTKYGTPKLNPIFIAQMASLALILYMINFISLFDLIILSTIVYIFIKGYGQIARSHIGGHTGDVLGASQQIMEVVMLIMICILMP